MKLINQKVLDQLTEKAKQSGRRRAILCFHSGDTDTMHRMLNALEPNTYVQPHCHPNKSEAFIVLQGRLLFVVFDEQGNPQKHEILEAATGNFGLEIPPQTYHTLIALETGTVIFEIKHGPYDALTDKTFATAWSPKEGEANCLAYNEQIKQRLGIK